MHTHTHMIETVNIHVYMYIVQSSKIYILEIVSSTQFDGNKSICSVLSHCNDFSKQTLQEEEEGGTK